MNLCSAQFDLFYLLVRSTTTASWLNGSTNKFLFITRTILWQICATLSDSPLGADTDNFLILRNGGTINNPINKENYENNNVHIIQSALFVLPKAR